MEIFKSFTFDSAHWLPNVPDDHKCKNMHGHTYQLTVYIDGPIEDPEGWVMDFGDLKSIIQPLIDKVDHKVLNEIEGLENPTCEYLCSWFGEKIKSKIPGVSKIELNETPTSGAVLRF